MGRELNTTTLDGAALHYAAAFMQPNRLGPSGRLIQGPDYVIQDLYNLHFKDEYDYLIAGIKEHLGKKSVEEFERLRTNEHTKRDEKILHALLDERLAIDPDGAHKDRRIGLVEVGRRHMGVRPFEVETPWSIRRRKMRGLPLHVEGRDDRETMVVNRSWTWPIYAGEEEERASGSDVPDALPGEPGWQKQLEQWQQAANPGISNEAAVAACDAIVDLLDEGSTAATIRGRTGTQPTSPDATEDGTLLFTLTMSDPAFGAAGDADPGGQAAADTITDDSSADATNTLSYCRAGATGTGADDHIDGSAGTSDADFIFNTLSIVSGAVISMSSFTVTVPET